MSLVGDAGGACRGCGPRVSVSSVVSMSTSSTDRPTRSLGLSRWAILGLAALALPLSLVSWLVGNPGTVNFWLLGVAPAVVWVAVAVMRRISAPLMTLVVVGLSYGIILAILQNLTFNSMIAQQMGAPYGGTAPVAVTVAARVAASLASILTGAVMGLITGLISQLLLRNRPAEH